ncbi:phage portal protein [Flavobacteriaceae bacterium]|nr:phage portal protein [Flavobacteriaceae bacterium]
MELIQLNQYEERSYRETANKMGFVNYGDDNLFPQYLVDLYHSSATHNALSTTIAMMIFGEGFDATTLDGRLAFDQWNLNDELRKACLDFKIQGGFALEVNWSIDRTTIANVSHLPFENIRSGFVNEDEKVEYYYYSKDWNDKREEPSEICNFNPERNIEHPTQILYVKPFSPGSFYYPKPDYVGSINYIELDKEIGVYHINNMKNGMSPSFSIHFKNGIPPQEERNRIRMDIERQLSGASNAGKFIVTYSDDPDRKPDFEPFQLSDAHNQYQFLSEEVTSKIMVGHRVTSPQMFGVAVPGKLGGGGELAEASELFEKNVIAPARQVVTEAVKTLLRAAGLDAQLVQLSEEPQEVNLDGCVDYLTDKGEEMGDEWELIDESPVDYDLEKARDAMWAFARVPSSNPNGKSEQDTEIIKVRYTYAPNSTQESSRDFCKKMVAAGKVYRKEDIEAASLRAVNPGFGEGGSNTYDLFLFKGGPRCHHYFSRQTYLRKNNKKISVNQAKKLIREAGVDAKRLPENDKRVAQRPVDMPNEGFINPR